MIAIDGVRRFYRSNPEDEAHSSGSGSASRGAVIDSEKSVTTTSNVVGFVAWASDSHQPITTTRKAPAAGAVPNFKVMVFTLVCSTSGSHCTKDPLAS